MITLLPGAVYFLLSLTGTDIILQWLCSVSSLSGIMVLSLFPIEVDRRLFKRLSILLAALVAVFFIGTTADLAFRTNKRLHIYPETVVAEAEKFWAEHSDGPIPVVVGRLRFAALIDHYSAQHPPVCDPDDDVMIDLYRERIRRRGALLIDSNPEELKAFLERAGGAPVKFGWHRVRFRAIFGKERAQDFALGYLPPGTEIK